MADSSQGSSERQSQSKIQGQWTGACEKSAGISRSPVSHLCFSKLQGLRRDLHFRLCCSLKHARRLTRPHSRCPWRGHLGRLVVREQDRSREGEWKRPVTKIGRAAAERAQNPVNVGLGEGIEVLEAPLFDRYTCIALESGAGRLLSLLQVPRGPTAARADLLPTTVFK